MKDAERKDLEGKGPAGKDTEGEDTEGKDTERQFRAFVRKHHPDVGGDPEVFLEGLAHYRSSTVERKPTGENNESTVDLDQREGRPTAEQEKRFDAPVSFVVEPSGFKAVTRKLKRWHQKRVEPPRVR